MFKMYKCQFQFPGLRCYARYCASQFEAKTILDDKLQQGGSVADFLQVLSSGRESHFVVSRWYVVLIRVWGSVCYKLKRSQGTQAFKEMQQSLDISTLFIKLKSVCVEFAIWFYYHNEYKSYLPCYCLVLFKASREFVSCLFREPYSLHNHVLWDSVMRRGFPLLVNKMLFKSISISCSHMSYLRSIWWYHSELLRKESDTIISSTHFICI